MILFLSDLHLADTPERTTINLHSLKSCLRQTAKRAEELNVDILKIVLLGDIFEILKSQKWIDKKLRPWEECTPDHVRIVYEIFQSIIDVNISLFDEFNQILKDYPFVEIIYVPGNHDWPFNTQMGEGARKLFVEFLGLNHKAKQFSSSFVDTEHKTIATHGHERDPFNRYSDGDIALGDVIVVDFLLQLPIHVASNLNISQYDKSLLFLHELDNVRPQSPYAMALWLLNGIDNLSQDNQIARDSVSDAMKHCLSKLTYLRKTVKSADALRSATRWSNTLKLLINLLPTNLDTLKIATKLPTGAEYSSYEKFSRQELNFVNNVTGKEEYELILYGHTHIPEHICLRAEQPGKLPTQVYLNTGTWRRVHLNLSRTGFIRYDEESFVIIFNKNEQQQGLPRYEYHRIIRG